MRPNKTYMPIIKTHNLFLRLIGKYIFGDNFTVDCLCRADFVLKHNEDSNF